MTNRDLRPAARPALFLFLVGGFALGCGSSSTLKSADGATGGAASEELPACAWPKALDDPDAGRGSCHPARFYLGCDSQSGVSEECLSDDPAHCVGPEAVPGASFTCHDICGPNEYGAVCGAIGPGPISDPPTGCHGASATPAGTVFYCCPCLR